jgi:hypothetical protein
MVEINSIHQLADLLPKFHSFSSTCHLARPGILVILGNSTRDAMKSTKTTKSINLSRSSSSDKGDMKLLLPLSDGCFALVQRKEVAGGRIETLSRKGTTVKQRQMFIYVQSS